MALIEGRLAPYDRAVTHWVENGLIDDILYGHLASARGELEDLLRRIEAAADGGKLSGDDPIPALRILSDEFDDLPQLAVEDPLFCAEEFLGALRKAIDAVGEWALRCLLDPEQMMDADHALLNWNSRTSEWSSVQVTHARLPTLQRIIDVANGLLRRPPEYWKVSGLFETIDVIRQAAVALSDSPEPADWRSVSLQSLNSVHLLLTEFDSPLTTQAGLFELLQPRVDEWTAAIEAEGSEARRALGSALRARANAAATERARGEQESATALQQRMTSAAADKTQSNYFDTLAERFKWRARFMMGAVVASVGTSTGIVFGAAALTDNWQNGLVGSAAALPFLGLAAYFSRESSSDRKADDAARRVATQLATLDAFGEELTLEQRQTLRAQFGQALFAIDPAEPGVAMQAAPVELVQAVEALVRAAQGARTGVGGSG